MKDAYSSTATFAKGERVLYGNVIVTIMRGGTGRVSFRHPVTGMIVSTSTSKLRPVRL